KEQPANSLKPTPPANVAVLPPAKGTTKDMRDETANITTNKTSSGEKQQREQPKQNKSQQLAYNSTENNDRIIPQQLTEEINDARSTETKMNDASIAVDNLHKKIINDVTVTNTDPTTPNNKINNPTYDGPDYVRNDDNTENKRLRGIFRKATRFIKNTTSINAANDDNRLLIGGMAINLK
ncbi:MAG TPA: hypothetical protein VGG71_07155, partial [Chitinophagaceae bacterium]